ncbi:DUF5663 domain-containing protein [Patescibacteria group bacterium]
MNNEQKDVSQVKLKIMQEFGLEGIEEEKQDEFLAKMGEMILKRVFVETVEKLDDEGRAHFEKMLEEKRTSEEVEEFLKVKIPDYDQMLEGIVVELKEDLQGIEIEM